MVNTNTSATGGYVVPGATPAPLEGQDLQRFWNQVIAGITEIDPTMVTPRWFSEPGNIPDAGVAWCAFGFGARPSDTFPQIVHEGGAGVGGQGQDRLSRHEMIQVQTSFYDLGSESLADMYAAKLRDGLAIPQNREAMMTGGGFVLAYPGTIAPVPVVVKTRWLYRVDFDFYVRRQIDRVYPILNLLSAGGLIFAQEGAEPPLQTPFNVNP